MHFTPEPMPADAVEKCLISSSCCETFGADHAVACQFTHPTNLATIIAAIKRRRYPPKSRRHHTTPAETFRLHGLD